MEDKYSTEYHLTPKGSFTGTYRFFGRVEGNTIEPPANRVQTILVTVEQTSAFSEEYSYTDVIWGALGEEKTIQKLRAKFPPPSK